MKCDLCDRIYLCNRRAPQGARGLKFLLQAAMFYRVVVAPRKGRVG